MRLCSSQLEKNSILLRSWLVWLLCYVSSYWMEHSARSLTQKQHTTQLKSSPAPFWLHSIHQTLRIKCVCVCVCFKGCFVCGPYIVCTSFSSRENRTELLVLHQKPTMNVCGRECGVEYFIIPIKHGWSAAGREGGGGGVPSVFVCLVCLHNRLMKESAAVKLETKCDHRR